MPSRAEVEVFTWREFLRYVADTWEPGEHWAVSGPTGEGKTTFTAGIAKLRRNVLGLDQKGGDKTLAKLGWPRMEKWPPSRSDRRDMAEGIPFRRIIGSIKRDKASRVARRALHKQVLEAVMEEGGWTVLAPDLRALTGRQFGGAWDEVVELLILLRDAEGSMITDFQNLTGIPTEAPDMATYLALGYTRDKDSVTDLARAMGRSSSAIQGAVEGLHDLPHGWLVVSRRPRDPIMLTRPEAL